MDATWCPVFCSRILRHAGWRIQGSNHQPSEKHITHSTSQAIASLWWLQAVCYGMQWVSALNLSVTEWASCRDVHKWLKLVGKKAHFETTNIFIKRTHFFNQCIDSVARLCLLPDRLISAFLQSDRALCGFDCACGRCYSKGAVEVAASHHVFKWQGKHVCANAKRCTTLCVGRLHPAGQFLHCFNWNR